MLLAKLGDQTELSDFVQDLINYKNCQTKEIFKLIPEIKKTFKFNIPKFIAMKDRISEKINLKDFKFKSETVLNFKLNNLQIEQITNYNNLFGTTLEGVSRTLTRVYVKKLLRAVEGQTAIENLQLSDTNRRWGGELVGI